jgi:hypothetical protein
MSPAPSSHDIGQGSQQPRDDSCIVPPRHTELGYKAGQIGSNHRQSGQCPKQTEQLVWTDTMHRSGMSGTDDTGRQHIHVQAQVHAVASRM